MSKSKFVQGSVQALDKRGYNRNKMTPEQARQRKKELLKRRSAANQYSVFI